jgi:hypothetical protein
MVGYTPKLLGVIFASTLLTLSLSASAWADVITLVKPANNAPVSGQVQLQVIDQVPPVNSVEYDIDGQFLVSGGPTLQYRWNATTFHQWHPHRVGHSQGRERSRSRYVLGTGDGPKRRRHASTNARTDTGANARTDATANAHADATANAHADATANARADATANARADHRAYASNYA